ncbi:MAG: ATP-binding protein [Chloroflexota bacterium]
MWTLELRATLFILLMLPLLGASFALSVSWLRKHRHQVKEQVGLLQSLFYQAPVGLLIFNRAYTLLSINENACHLLQIPSQAVTLPDTPWANLLHQDLQEANRYRTLEVEPGDQNQNGDDRVVIRWWITHHQNLVLVLLFDMTNEEQAEHAANRLLSDLSHELRTPLATILTHLQVLSLPDMSDQVREQSIQFMKDETQRLVRMSNRTLELGQLQANSSFLPKNVALKPLIEGAVSQMQVEAVAKDTRIVMELADSLPFVLGDPDQLHQVLLNLLDNAIKYGETSNRNGPDNRILISLRRVEKGVACIMQDRGPGIPEEHLPYLERRYYRAGSSNIAGSGLGLSMVREILHRHKSQLEITSRTKGSERGTTVRFTLPAAGSNIGSEIGEEFHS